MIQEKTFDSTEEYLFDMLKNIRDGKIQLPDFQRGWVWDDNRIRSLLASISSSFPIGALMVLETDESIRFKPRPIEGVVTSIQTPEKFVLDGQQRLTSLFQVLLWDKPVETKDTRNNRSKRWYYIDMQKALDDNIDREDAILSIPGDKIIKNFRNEVVCDYSTSEKEYQAEIFPFNNIFDSSNWRTGYNEFWQYEKEKTKFYNQFEREIIKRFERYLLPVIKLLKGTPKEAVCLVFEKVNTAGVALNVFELLTATFAMDDYSLRDDWQRRKSHFKNYNNLKNVESTDFLQAITLLITRDKRLNDIKSGKKEEEAHGISCKKKDILNLSLSEYKKYADAVEEGFKKVSRLLYSQRFFSYRDIPYRTQTVPLAAILTILDRNADNDTVSNKLLRWFWCGVFGELYGSAIETRFAKDVQEVPRWIDGGNDPSTIAESNFMAERLFKLRTRNSAAYKGLFALLMRDGGLDFRTGELIQDQIYFDDKVDIHHIFPKDWCEKSNKPMGLCNCIVNKTPISSITNRSIGKSQPRVYLDKLEKRFHINAERMNEILRSHVIEPQFLREDNFEAFFKARTEALLQRIEKMMGKKVFREATDTDLIVIEEDEIIDEEEEYFL
ncbi:MAG: DUF262 domain-containing protein [bacterium]